MTGAEVERVHRPGSPLSNNVEGGGRVVFCMPSHLRNSLGGHTVAAQIRLPQTYRASEYRTVATPDLVEAFRLP